MAQQNEQLQEHESFMPVEAIFSSATQNEVAKTESKNIETLLKDKEKVNETISEIANLKSSVEPTQEEKETREFILGMADRFANGGKKEKLQINLDRDKAQKEVAEVTESDFFKKLQGDVKKIRGDRSTEQPAQANISEVPLTDENEIRRSGLTTEQIEFMKQYPQPEVAKRIYAANRLLQEATSLGLSEELQTKYELIIKAAELGAQGETHSDYLAKQRAPQKLEISIDQAQREKDHREITDSDFFKDLKAKAKKMRDEHAQTQSQPEATP